MHQTYRNPVQRYNEVQSQTATPGEILLALYDGLFRFLNTALRCLDENKKGLASQQLRKCHAIISELMIALDDAKAPEICANLRSLYNFCLDRLMFATIRSDRPAVEDVIRVLSPLRDAWIQAVPMAHAEKSAAGR